MIKHIKKVLALFSKPKEEINPHVEIPKAEWPFPVETKKRKLQVKKATTRPVVKKATTVAKKTTKKKAKVK